MKKWRSGGRRVSRAGDSYRVTLISGTAHAFQPLSANGRRLFIPMAEVAGLFA